MFNDDFETTARMLGHDLEKLHAGEEVTSTLTFDDIHAFKDFMRKECINPAFIKTKTCEELEAEFPGLAEDHTEQGVLRKVEAYIYNDVPLESEIEASIASTYPIEMEVSSEKDKIIDSSGLIINQTTKPQLKNWDTVTMQSGAFIAVYSVTIGAWKLGTVNRMGFSSRPYDIGILGVSGGAGTAGVQGKTGGVGGPGTAGSVGSSNDPVQPTAGKTGGTGASGGTVIVGKRPIGSRPANIVIDSITGSQPHLTMITRSGTGGDGGKGGTGGRGGTGGVGGKAASWDCYYTNAGNGGPGGKGGTGGGGGAGSNGADGSQYIYVTIPQSEFAKLTTEHFPAPAGRQGAPGAPGAGGPGGTQGALTSKGGVAGVAGGTGSGGSPGNLGPTGAQAGIAYPILHHSNS